MAGDEEDGRPVAQAGQAQLELVASLPILIAAALVVLQLMSVGYAQSLADGSAEAGALALAAGRPAESAARSAVPGWAASRVEAEINGGRVRVRLRPRSLLPGLGSRLSVDSEAWARPAPGAAEGG
jgi:hypothetical protein